MPSEGTWTSVQALNSPDFNARDRTWQNTPGFKALQASGREFLPINGYGDRQYRGVQQRRVRKYTPPGGVETTSYDGYAYQNAALIGYVDTYVSAFSNYDAAIDGQLNRCKVKAYTRVSDAKVNIAVALAEAHKTSSLILDTAKKVDRAFRAFRKGNLKGVAEILNITPKRVHKTWLEYKYGWMPLLMDVRGAAEFFAQQYVSRASKFVVSASDTVTETASIVVDDVAYGGGSLPANHSVFVSGSRTVKVKLWCGLSSPRISELQQLGVTNPALIAWELIPFSFVFDWFVSVGDYLQALTAFQGVDVYKAMYSISEGKGFTQNQPATVNVVSGYTYTSNGLSLQASKRFYDRAPFVPNILDLYPPKNSGLNFNRLVTSLALIRGGYRGTARV